MTFRKSKEFPGIAFDFDEKAQPFFKAIIKDNLRKVRAINHGRDILNAIANASPASRSNFPKKVNVIIQPPLERIWVSPGMNKRGAMLDQGKYDNFMKVGGVGKSIPSMASKTSAEEQDKAAACGGGGSVCRLYFSNNEIVSGSGEWLPPHITMGHELIHCVNGLYGTMKADNKEEEWQTVGIKGFAGNYTENQLRADANINLRTKYFATD